MITRLTLTQLTMRLIQSLLASPSLAPCVNIEMESDPPAEQHTLGTVDFSLHGIWVYKFSQQHQMDKICNKEPFNKFGNGPLSLAI